MSISPQFVSVNVKEQEYYSVINTLTIFEKNITFLIDSCKLFQIFYSVKITLVLYENNFYKSNLFLIFI